MKLTVPLRNRITETAAGILLIILTLQGAYSTLQVYSPGNSVINSFSEADGQTLRIMVLFLIASLFFAVLGVMLIFRAYRFLPLKILYCITAIAVLANTGGGMLIRGLCGEELLSDAKEMPASYMIRYMAETLVICAVIVIGLLSISRKITWRSREALLAYAFIALVLLALFKTLDRTYLIVVLLPFFMQDSTNEKDPKGVIGNAALLISFILPYIMSLIFRFTGYSDTVIKVLNVILMILCFVAPLMVFERDPREIITNVKEKAAKK